MKPIIFILFSFLSFSIFGQNLFSGKNFDEEELGRWLMDSLNEERLSKTLHPLKFDEILEAAAYEQAEYLLEKGNFDHSQENSKFKTLNDRVSFFGGRYAGLGENIFLIQTSVGNQRRGRSNEVELNRYSDVVSVIFNAWKEKEESHANLYDPDFYNMATVVLYDSVKHELAVVSVFSTESYPERRALKLQGDLGLEVYDRNSCDNTIREYPAISELFGSNVSINNNEVWLKNVDKAMLEKIISSNSDGLAADIICKDQFPCDSGNRLFPGDIHDGYLLKPVNKLQLQSHLSEIDNEFHLLLGKLPTAFHGLECEVNILVIKDNKLCLTAPFNNFGGTNISWLYPAFEYSFQEDSLQSSVWSDSLRFAFHPEAAKSSTFTQLDSLLSYFGNVKAEVLSAEVEIYYSPIEAKRMKAEKWKEDLQEHLKQYSFDGELKVDEKVAWAEYQDFIKNRIYSLETQKLDSTELSAYLKEEYQKDGPFRVFMDSLNRINLNITTRNAWKSQVNNRLIEMYEFLLDQKQLLSAIKVQEKLIATKNTEYLKKIANIQIPLKKAYADLANNQLLLQISTGIFDHQKGKTLKQSFGEILYTYPDQAIVQYNYLVATIKEWSANPKNANGIDEWLKSYLRINKKPIIADSNLKKLLLNYHILVADHYYETAKFEERKKELEKVVKLIQAKELTEKEANFYAEYLMFQLQLPTAMKLLKKFAMEEKPMQKTLKNILSIGVYGYKVLSKEEKNQMHHKYAQLYPESYCGLFGSENMGFQQLNNPDIKQTYCDTCQ